MINDPILLKPNRSSMKNETSISKKRVPIVPGIDPYMAFTESDKAKL
jgi:hypothetical protein